MNWINNVDFVVLMIFMFGWYLLNLIVFVVVRMGDKIFLMEFVIKIKLVKFEFVLNVIINVW